MENLNTNKKLNTYIDNIKKLVIENEFLKHSMNSIKTNKKNNNVTINVENATPEQKEVINEFYQKDIDMLNKQLAQQNQLLQNAHQNQLPININVPSNHNLENRKINKRECNLKEQYNKNREFREKMFQLNRENRIRQSELNRESRERIAELDRKIFEVKKEEFLKELNNIKKEKEEQLKELEELKTIKKNDIYNKNILNEEINYYNKLNNNIKNNKININNLLKKLKSKMVNYNNNNRLNNYNLEQNEIQIPRILFVIKKKGLI